MPRKFGMTKGLRERHPSRQFKYARRGLSRSELVPSRSDCACALSEGDEAKRDAKVLEREAPTTLRVGYVPDTCEYLCKL